jgi:hypothetical protein
VTTPKNARSFAGRRFYDYRGQKLESVTSLLGAGLPKDWLKFWAAKDVATTAVDDSSWREMEREEAIAYLKGSPWRKRDKAGDHGTVVHDALAALARGAKSYKGPDTLRAHVKAVGEFWRAYRPQPIYVESQVFSLSQGYAGSFDLLAWIYGRLLLIDAKTSSVLGHEMRLQLAAYRYADFIGQDDKVLAPMPAVHGTALLWIPRDLPEQWQLIEVKAERDEFEGFLRAKATAEMIHAQDEQSIGELILPQAVEAIA